MHQKDQMAYVAVHHHFPVRHTILNNWVRYQRKRIKVGALPEEQCILFEELAASRHLDEHTGGRRKKEA